MIRAARRFTIRVVVNGTPREARVAATTTLVDLLRDQLGLVGTKIGCGTGECGACTVLLDDAPVVACLVLAPEVDGRHVTTIEAEDDARLAALQSAFVAEAALQCGFCTPGFVLTTTALLRANPKPTEAEVRHACAGNLCRCGSQPHIIQAALAAAGVATTSTADSLRHDHV